MKRLIWSVLVWALSMPSWPADSGITELSSEFYWIKNVVSGPHYSFTLIPPKGWVLQDPTDTPVDSDVVFRSSGITCEKAPSFFYVNVCHKGSDIKTAVDVVRCDLDHFRKFDPKIQIQELRGLPTGDGKRTLLYYFAWSKQGKRVEECAYIEEKDLVVFLDQSSRNEKDFQKDKDLFVQMVSSYRFSNKGYGQ